ncbi:MAG: cytochrome b/b6 domain-containing protein [Desulfuromonadaceae bacterium]|nr:cytochrome b/b6 domain-containing protein [Desulfuromonadaceae bacterium]
MMKPKLVYLQPTPVRIWHWLNALGIVTLCISGAQIRFPEFITICGSYRSAILLHNTAGIVVALSFSIWFFYYKWVSGALTSLYVPKMNELSYPLLRQLLFYCYGYFKGASSPFHATPDSKFNPMQKSAYLAIMFVIVPFVSLSGIALLNIGPIRQILLMVGGLQILVIVHFLLACMLGAFLMTHVYLATLGSTPLAYFKPMWTGWEKVEHHDNTDEQPGLAE